MDLACIDWQERLCEGRSPFADLELPSPAEADRAEAIFKRLRLPDVPGTPRIGDSTGQWAFDVVRAMFGSVTPDGRTIREFFVCCPKKQGKSSLGGAMMLTALLLNKRPRAEYVIVAPTQQVSEISFRQVCGMIEADKYLTTRFHIREHLKRIEDRTNQATLAVKSWSPSVVTGIKPSGILLDELHVQQHVENADRVLGQARGGMVSQPEAFLLTISTQSERPPAGVWRAELQKARMVRDGKLKGVPLLPAIWEFPKDFDWRDVANWPLVLPNNGFSMTAERLVPDYEAAKAAGPEELARWASQHLNVEVGIALRADGWVGADFWLDATDDSITLDSILSDCDAVAVGIDGGGRADLLGVAVVGRSRTTKQWLTWGHAYAHESVLAKHTDIAPRLRDFAAQGDVTIISGDADIQGVVALVQKVLDAGCLAGVACDPYGIGSIPQALAEIGVEPVGISQGWKLTAAIKTAERMLSDGTLLHGGQPLLAWNVTNAKTEPKGNATSITKATTGACKIDTLIAVLNAVALMTTNPEPVRHQSIYDRLDLADLLAPIGR